MGVIRVTVLVLSLFLSSMTLAEEPREEVVDEISTVGGKLWVMRTEDDPNENYLILDEQKTLPIATDMSITINDKLKFSDDVDFVIFSTYPGGNASPITSYVLRITKGKTWTVTDISCTSYDEKKEGRFFKDKNVVKVVFPRDDGYLRNKVTATVSAEGVLLKEETELEKSSMLPPVCNFDDIIKENMPLVALLRVPEIREDLVEKHTFSYVNNFFEGRQLPDLSFSENKEVIFGGADGSHADEYAEYDIWSDRSGKYWIFFPDESGLNGTRYNVFTNLSDLQIKLYFQDLLKEDKYNWFDRKDFRDNELFINGQKTEWNEALPIIERFPFGQNRSKDVRLPQGAFQLPR